MLEFMLATDGRVFVDGSWVESVNPKGEGSVLTMYSGKIWLLKESYIKVLKALRQ
jgi:hypothetical protein